MASRSRRLFASLPRPPPDVWPLLTLVAGGTVMSGLVAAHHILHNMDVSPKLIHQADPRVPRFEGALDTHAHWELWSQGQELNRKIEHHEHVHPVIAPKQ